LVSQEVKHGREFRDRRLRIETPVLSENEREGFQPSVGDADLESPREMMTERPRLRPG
jgi:hypothetical protein